jgi:F-type H+-transporting ATPase subunit alpha
MTELRYTEHGTVRCIRGCIVIVDGFKNCINGQLVRFGYGTMGLIIGFNEHEAQILIVRQQEQLKTGDKAVATLEPFHTPVGNSFIGRIVTPLGETLDGLGPLKTEALVPIFIQAPPILQRKPIEKTVETGIKLIDAMIPIGYGQRELILGDKMTGKTTIATDMILNQKNTGVICIYCCIGKVRSALAKVVQLFQDRGCFDYSLIVSATAASPPGQQYLAPYVACSVGEFFLNQGKNVLVIFDDFTKHAWCYREISLLLGRPPGRDSYPGDVFYLHSRLIERACYLDEEHGGGSMTFVPIAETLEGDLTGYIQSNLISMTDGQIMVNASLFNEGQRPAVDLGLSVSRIGNKVQWPIIKALSASLRLEYLQYREILRISKLKTSSQSEELNEQLNNGEILTEILKQDKDSPVPMEIEAVILYAYTKKFLHDLSVTEIRTFQQDIGPFVLKKNPELLQSIRDIRDLTKELIKEIDELLEQYLKEIQSRRSTETPKDSNVGVDVLDEATSKKSEKAIGRS